MPDVLIRPWRRWRSRAHCLVAGACLLLGLVLPCGGSAATRLVVEDYAVTGWTVEDGLPHNLVHAIAQDARGLLWAATWEGAARFNGRSFRVFDRENTPGAELSGVFNFLPEANGDMLAGTADGVYRYHDGVWSPVAPGLAGVRVDAMMRGQDGSLWVAALFRLYQLGADGQLRELSASYALPGARITALAQQPDGVLVVGTEDGLYRIIDGKAQAWGRELGMGDTTVRRLIPDRQGGWYLAADNGVWQISAAGQAVHLRPSRRTDTVMLDRNGVLWINESAGDVVRRDPRGNETALKVPGVLTAGLMEDVEGLIWVGSSAGLFQISRGAAHNVAGSESYARAVLQTEDSAIWIGHSRGLNRLRAGVMRAVSQQDPEGYEDSVPALALAREPNSVWAGTYSRGVLRFDAAGKVVQRIALETRRASPMVRALAETADGTLWIGTASAGVYRYRDGAMSTLSVPEGLPSEAVQVLYEDPDGGLWIGTTGGMARIDADGSLRSWVARKDMPAQSVFDFHRDQHGRFWIATDRGLLLMRGDEFVVFDHDRGLPKDKVFRIIEEDGEYLWLPSNRGVFRIDQHEIAEILRGTRQQLSVVVVDDTDGMPSSQGNGGTWPAGWRTQAGNVLIATASGVGMIEPGRLEQVRHSALPVLIEAVIIDGERRDPRIGINVKGDAHRITISYAGLDFRASQRVRYRYRMAGFDRDWIDAGDSTEAIYTNLPPGNYRFELQAMRMPVDWTRTALIGSVGLDVVVKPPLWRHWGFITLAVLAAASVWIGGWRWRLSRYRHRQEVLRRVIDERTRELVEKNKQLEISARERDALMQKLSYQASHDPLTGLPNRRAADSHLDHALAAALAQGQPLCVALLDIDHFKGINDGYGHEAGDQVLRRIGARLQNLSAVDVFSSRHGGEEFLLVLEGMSETEARHTLETLRKDIAAETLTLENGSLLRYTISVGMACYGPYLNTLRQLLGTADRNLYTAKSQGRNRVVG